MNINKLALTISKLNRDHIKGLSDLRTGYKLTTFGSKEGWLDSRIKSDEFCEHLDTDIKVIDAICISFIFIQREEVIELNKLLKEEGIKFLEIRHHTTYHEL